MAQGDLFAEDSTLELPAVRYGPIRVAIGVVEAILRPASAVEAKRVGEIQVSARLKEPLYQAANGERLVVTTRKNIARPGEADGVLLQSESGNKSRTAGVLGIDPSTLYGKLARYGIDA